MQCVRCPGSIDIPGRVHGMWICPDCVAKQEAEERRRRVEYVGRIRQHHAEGKCVAHVHYGVLPAIATDAEAQRYCDDLNACWWERQAEEIVFYGEM